MLGRSGSANAGLRAAALGVLAAAASAAPVRAEEPAAPLRSKFYSGLELASVKFDDSYGGIDFNGTTPGAGLYTGYWVNDRLSVELAYDWTDALDLRDIAGSGIRRFDITSERHTVSVSVLRQVVLRDFFNLKRDWRVFGTLGVYESRVDRTVTDLVSSTRISTGDSGTGASAAAGVLYTVGRFELRGYLRGWGDAREIGAAAQLRF